MVPRDCFNSKGFLNGGAHGPFRLVYRHWRGIFYPDTERTDRWFSHYVHEFKTVELNSPSHKWSKLGTINSWKRTGRPGFCCSVKLSELITHQVSSKIFNDDRESYQER